MVRLPAYQLLIPFTSDYRPLWVAIGMLSGYLAVVLVLSTYAIGLIGFRAWRKLHYAGVIVWLLATLHGLLAVHDPGAIHAVGPYAIATILVVVSLVFRTVRRPSGGLAPSGT